MRLRAFRLPSSAFECHEYAMPISEALRQSLHFKVAAVASHWQCVGDFIVSGFVPHIART